MDVWSIVGAIGGIWREWFVVFQLDWGKENSQWVVAYRLSRYTTLPTFLGAIPVEPPAYLNTK